MKEPRKTAIIYARATEETKEKLVTLAWERRMSISEYLEMIILDAPHKRGRPRSEP